MNLSSSLQGPLAGRYRLERELGRGGMAIVFLAEDLKHQRQVAIKVLRPDLAASVGRDRFLREITLAAGLQHPHILPLHDSGAIEADGETILFYVMPYVQGQSLRQRLEETEQLPIDEALTIAREVLSALESAHRAGVVHRDIKPENILLSGGHALVADFGIAVAAQKTPGDARLTDVGSVVGTPAYMSPEQAAGEREIDARSDLYAFGCVLFEMLAGTPPFRGASSQAIMVKRLTEDAPSVRRLRAEVPDVVDAALQRVLSRPPEARFPTAASFAAALQPGYVGGATPVPASAPRRGRWPQLLGALAVVVAAVAWFGSRSPKAAPPGEPKLALTDLVVANRDSSTEYLRSGIPEFLASALLHLPGLEVVPMSTVRRDSLGGTPAELGRRVGATAVLTGSLARYGGNLWINAELVQVADGRLVWSGQFQYPDTNYAGVVPALVAVIADSLRLQLSSGLRSDVLRHTTVDPVVLDLVLRAGRGWLQGIAGAEGDSATIDSSRMLYSRVLERDPNNARAIAGLGDYYSISFIRGWGVSGLTPLEIKQRADSLVDLALSIDSALPNAWNQIVVDRMYLEDDFDGTDDALTRMKNSDPNSAEYYRLAGVYQQEIMGNLSAALDDFRKAVENEPSIIRLNSYAAGLMAARRYQEAAEALERSMAMRPSAGARWRLIATYEHLGRRADATRIRREADPTGQDAAPFEAALAAGDTAAYSRARRAELQKSADSLIARLSMADVVPAERYNVAELRIDAMLCELGESTKAMDLVENLYRIRPKRLRWIVTNVDLGCLRDDPRYLPMVKAAGLEPYLRN
ncbi:MAG TPA: protein kinase [Gemmatimonadales bacterium]|nr:protein kinase [Gemmatimonadales bacterium]